MMMSVALIGDSFTEAHFLVYARACMHVCVCVFAREHVHACVQARMLKHVWGLCVCVRVCVCVCVCVCVDKLDGKKE